MNIKIGGWYHIHTDGFYMDGDKKIQDYIVEVSQKRMSQGLSLVKWKCKVQSGKFKGENKSLRRRAFATYLGDDYLDALDKSPEFFI